MPAVVVGVLVGVVFVDRVDDTVMRRTIGIILLVLVTVHLLRLRRPRAPYSGHHRLATIGYGSLAGFTTMVANAGGAAMSLYLLTMGLSVLRFLGTTAWFFFLLNLFKLPFSIGLGLVSRTSLMVDLLLVPAVLVGTVVGRRVIDRIDQQRFELLVLASTVIASIPLVW
jgi:uncharacterized membrane protein YfcA